MVTESYIGATENLLRTGLSNLETDLGGIEAAAHAVYNDPRFRRLSYLDDLLPVDYFHSSSLVEDFRRIFMTAGMIRDCGIVFGNNMILTTRRLHFPWEQFYGKYFKIDGIPTAEQWIARKPLGCFTSGLLSMSNFITLEGSYQAITYYANFPDFPGRRAFFFATLDKNYIVSRLITDDLLRMGRILIYDPSGLLILYDGIQTSGRDYITLESIGERRSIRVVVEIPRRVFHEQLTPFRLLAFTFVIFYLVFGVILSIVFARRSAMPVKEIVQDVLSFGNWEASLAVPSKNLSDFKSDYKYIQNFLSKMNRDIETFNAKFAQQEERYRENMLERLLYGLVYSDWQTVRDHFPDFPEVFCIAVAALPNMEEAALSVYTMRQEMISDIIRECLPAGEYGKTYIHFSSNLLVLILPGRDQDDLACRLNDLINNLRLKLNVQCRVALSEPERDIKNIYQAFFMARHLLRLPVREGEGIILQKGNRDLLSFPLELMDTSRFYELLFHGEEEKAIEFVNNMFYEFCKLGFTGEDEIQQIFFIYRRVLIKITGDLSLEILDGMIPAYDSHLELSFLFARIADAARMVCCLVNSRRVEKDKSFERSVVDFIDENLTNSGLYTKMVTGFFNISENRLQAVIRKWTGKSFLEYVESKRMALSRELLLKTTKSISTITKECGYSSENSFYKAFRRFYGLSPSEIRK